MPANLELLHRQRFELTLSDGTIIPGQFGTYATSLFGKKKNLMLSQINFIVEQKSDNGEVKTEDGKPLYDVRIHDMIDFVMCAIEAAAKLKGDRFTFTDPQLCQWVDDYFYDTGKPNALIELYGHSIIKQDEKKNQDTPKSN